MTVAQAESILVDLEIRIALRHRFGGGTGTILRLENYAMINIFDDGRYYIQGENTEAVLVAFRRIEEPWDPDSWVATQENTVLPWFPPKSKASPPKRFEL